MRGRNLLKAEDKHPCVGSLYHAFSFYIFLPTCLILSTAILKHQCKIMPSGKNHPIFMFLSILPSQLLLESLQKKRVPQREVEFYVNKILLVISGIAISEIFFSVILRTVGMCVCVYKRVEFLSELHSS